MKKIITKISTSQAISYPIVIDTNLIMHPNKWLPHGWHNKQLVIITDNTVKKHYGTTLLRLLKKAKPLLFSFLPGENSKNYLVKHSLEEKMLKNRCNRETLILALGGGVVGDMAGFIAATYMRGIAYIQIPTTLLAMVDSSVGGKTAINTSQGKNLIGAFWQPTKVIIDTNCLTTLPEKHIINGLIEALKMFMTNDKKAFDHIHAHIDTLIKNKSSILKNIIYKAIQIKTTIVSLDEKEKNERMILNFGHTIGHALEKILNFKILHGYAVGLGILVEAKISQLLGILSNDNYQLIKHVFLKLGISTDPLKKINSNLIVQATKSDKKAKKTGVQYILLKEIGKVYTKKQKVAHSVADNIVIRALIEIHEA